ncbi:MAG TPA: glycosyltransferase [Candidatus Sumerlaeota bacterium]|nr:glycosyltransferase [Candidatus Sumerlaeota bacterium]
MAGKPTVLYLLDYMDLGGGETSFLALLEEMARREWPVRPVVILNRPGPVAERLAALGIAAEIVGYPLRLRRGPLPWFSPAAAARIGRIARERDATLLHAIHFFGMVYGGFAARRLGLPLVWTCHGWFDVDRPVKRILARRFAAHIACVSDAVREEASRRIGPGRPVTTNYLGVAPYPDAGPQPARTAVRAELGVDDATPVVGMIGRFQPIKGHDLLLDALRRVLPRRPGLKVWIIGDALFGSVEEAAHRRRIEARVEAEGLGPVVNFLGFRRDARRVMRALDLLVIPSARESFSMVAVEGLEAGIPVVGPDGWGPREIIESPATGLRFRPGDAEDLARCIGALLERTGDGAAFSPAAGPDRVRRLFSVAAHLERTLAIYRELTGERTGGEKEN